MKKEAYEATVYLNDQFYEMLPEGESPEFLGFKYSAVGYSEYVSFMGINLWSTNDETRIWKDDTEEYESYVECFRRQVLSIIQTLVDYKEYIKGQQI